MQAAYSAFREPFLLSDPIKVAITGDFNDFESRRLRYAIYWTFFENTAFATIHNWSKTYKVEAGLYEYIRNIKNPSYQLGEFWKSHLWGGELDREAGDGKEIPSALPLATDNELLRPAIAQVWKWSNWQLLKDLATLWGTVLGDVGLIVADDTEKGKVCIRVIHPGTIKAIEKDGYGNVKAYTIQEYRQDPESTTEKVVTYTEEATREGEMVIYRTYRDKNLYAWPGQFGTELDRSGKPRLVAEWEHPYGFVPLVMVQHNNVGLDWGWSEIHPMRSRIQEVDDLASKLSDQIRKEIDPFWLFSGVPKPSTTPEASKPTLTGTSLLNRPMLGREAVNVLYATDPAAKAQPLVGDLDIEQASAYISGILDDLKQNCPELMNLFETGNDPSGRAIRITRQPVETKVKQRRANYDDALVRIQQMAVSIGGYRQYDAFKGFGLDSYDNGDLEHSIGDRPIFPPDPIDKVEQDNLFWQGAASATGAGMTLEAYLRDAGWSDERLVTLLNSEEYKLKLEAQKAGLEGMKVANKQKGENPEEDNQDDNPT